MRGYLAFQPWTLATNVVTAFNTAPALTGNAIVNSSGMYLAPTANFWRAYETALDRANQVDRIPTLTRPLYGFAVTPARSSATRLRRQRDARHVARYCLLYAAHKLDKLSP
jgi:hypothetical protein